MQKQFFQKIDYNEAIEKQKIIANKVLANDLRGALLYFEPTPVLTFGSQVNDKNFSEHFFKSEDNFKLEGFNILKLERGGAVTYHGPGTLVGFPVLNLKKIFGDKKAVRACVHFIESAIIEVLKEYQIESFTDEKYPGVWTKQGKIAFIGLRIKDGLTYHGFSINVHNDLSIFNHFMPCNIKNCRVTSINNFGKSPELTDIIEKLNKKFSEVL